MKHYGLIGEKLGHSLSRPIHEAIFRELGVEADYRIIEIPRGDFVPLTKELLSTLDGFNITIPYKQDVMPLLTAIDPAAKEIGAVNTVICGESAASTPTRRASWACCGITALTRRSSTASSWAPAARRRRCAPACE